MSTGSARSASTRRGDQQRRTSAGGEPRRLDTEARAGQLIDVAKRLFAQRAYDEVKVEDVAAAAKPPKSLELAVRGWLGFTESACLSWLDSRNVPREELREIFAQVLVAAALTAWPDDARPLEARITT